MCKKNLRVNMFVFMLITVLVISLLPLSAAAELGNSDSYSLFRISSDR